MSQFIPAQPQDFRGAALLGWLRHEFRIAFSVDLVQALARIQAGAVVSNRRLRNVWPWRDALHGYAVRVGPEIGAVGFRHTDVWLLPADRFVQCLNATSNHRARRRAYRRLDHGAANILAQAAAIVLAGLVVGGQFRRKFLHLLAAELDAGRGRATRKRAASASRAQHGPLKAILAGHEAGRAADNGGQQ